MTALETILSASGPIAATLGDGFEARAEQQALAQAVNSAMESRSHLLAEAGTGIGKSFAYLLPAILRCRAGERVVISTHTISLQEQLVHKDIPLLLRALGLPLAPEEPPMALGEGAVAWPAEMPVRPILAKGRGNYLSIRRLQLASQRQDRLFGDPAARRSLHVVEDWAYQTREGTLSSLPRLERPAVWDRVQSDSGNCMGRKCPTYEQCFYQNARARLDGANLIVCNHALFFADLALRTQDFSILPEYDHVILDEAHSVEDIACEHFGVTLSESRVNFLLGTLVNPRSARGGYLPQLVVGEGENAALDRAISLASRAMTASRAFFESLVSHLRAVKREGGGAPRRPGAEFTESDNVLRLRTPGAVANTLTPVMRELALRLRSLQQAVTQDADRFELNAYAQRAEAIAADADVLLSQALPDYAYWIELSGFAGDDETGPGARQSTQRVSLGCAPIEVAPILRERLFRQKFSVVLTSATLATRSIKPDETQETAETAFAHIIGRLGCEGARVFQAGSPFDYAAQASIHLVRSLATGPRGGEDSQIEPRPLPFNQALAAHILHHVRETDGGAFVLFTSFASLNAVASELAEPLAEMGIPLLAQGRDGSRTHILQRFRENDRSVLLGAASFWQGVDVRGRALRNVIITKLPFDPPDRPLTQARLDRIEERGGNPFMEESLPRAIVRFKQGFGRLIRSKSDTGRIVVLDPRVLTARYGRAFLAAFPPGIPTYTE
ncbi:MAG: hypothetical protein KF864_08175 [Phycisphaeraceae bacterium]|nr:hypothetical protein [Phycisphaeraceae bacterium]MBX3409119.1 hypothetical protein [Phycisphaeraceae bacterium]